jgi:hypothetical protein
MTRGETFSIVRDPFVTAARQLPEQKTEAPKTLKSWGLAMVAGAGFEPATFGL